MSREDPRRPIVGRALRACTIATLLSIVAFGAIAVHGSDTDSSAGAVAVTARRQTTTCTVDPATMTAPGCTMLRLDAGGAVNAVLGRWGQIDCASDARYRHVVGGGDTHREANGARQKNRGYRELRVIDGDDYFGERCELGRNSSEDGENGSGKTSGTFALYGEGEHKITFFSERYPASFPTAARAWQVVMQMKQAQPYVDGNVGVALTLQLFGGLLRLYDFDVRKWAAPAPRHGVWVRYALDVVYSTDPGVGSVKIYADLNGDGDALDKGEQSPRMPMRTLATDIRSGEPIPDHLRLGIYHDPSVACPPPSGCVIDIDNVQVVG